MTVFQKFENEKLKRSDDTNISIDLFKGVKEWDPTTWVSS